MRCHRWTRSSFWISAKADWPANWRLSQQRLPKAANVVFAHEVKKRGLRFKSSVFALQPSRPYICRWPESVCRCGSTGCSTRATSQETPISTPASIFTELTDDACLGELFRSKRSLCTDLPHISSFALNDTTSVAPRHNSSYCLPLRHCSHINPLLFETLPCAEYCKKYGMLQFLAPVSLLNGVLRWCGSIRRKLTLGLFSTNSALS